MDNRPNRSIEFDESELSDLDRVAQLLFETDPVPRRVRVRPRIRWWRIAASTVLPVACAVGVGILLCRLGLAPWMSVMTAALLLLVYTLLRLKSGVLCCIRIYQRYAPDRIRDKCRFEPSCSCYMLASIQKYGLREGGKRGIRRLKRCRPGFGGFDPP